MNWYIDSMCGDHVPCRSNRRYQRRTVVLQLTLTGHQHEDVVEAEAADEVYGGSVETWSMTWHIEMQRAGSPMPCRSNRRCQRRTVVLQLTLTGHQREESVSV